jgi:Na+/melibiose symporter-like transporter
MSSPAFERSRLELGRASHPVAAAVHDAVRDAATRGTLAVGLGGIAVIHAVDSVGKWSETRYMFWMYMALIVGAIVLAAATLFHPSRVTFLAAAGLAATVMVGFIINRTVGMPQATDDIGNWTEPLGLASLVVEGLVVAVGLGGFLLGGRELDASAL